MLNRLFLPCLTFILLSFGCTQLYVPNVVNAPLMSEAGETQVGMQVATNGYNVQLAFSPAYHLSMMANGNIYTVKKGIDFDSTFKHQTGELGLGFYSRLSKYWRLETYAGYGAASTGDEIQTGVYRQFFFQPNIGVSGRIADFGFTPRFTFVNHIRDDLNNGASTVVRENKAAFFEPTFTLRAGYEQFKFHFQAGRSIPLGSDNLNGDFQPWSVSFGFHLTFVKDFEKYLN